MLREWIQHLLDNDIGIILEDEPLSKHTTWKIGGPADAFIEPWNRKSLIKSLTILNEYNIPWKVIGKGSNLLVRDTGYRGAIISLEKNVFNEIDITPPYIRVGANISVIRLANLTAKYGLTGLEFAGGIPGTVGGAIYMNAGAHGSDFSKIIKEADILTEHGDTVKWDNKDFNFNYRSSALQQQKSIILSAYFELQYGERKEIAEKMARYKDRRRKTQPYNMPCSGSVFRNPEGDYAGRLIEELNLKGFQIGGAQVSEKHANFIVNAGAASAKDVLDLIDYIKEKAYDKYGLDLKPEVEIVGEE